MLRSRLKTAFVWPNPMLGIYKDLLRMHVEHQPAVVNLRAVILFMRRIWAGNNAGRIMRVASAQLDRFFILTDISCQPLLS